MDASQLFIGLFGLVRPEVLAGALRRSGQLNERMPAEGFDLGAFLAEKNTNLAKTITDPRHIRWVLKDSLDRANLLRVKRSMVSDFISSVARGAAVASI